MSYETILKLLGELPEDQKDKTSQILDAVKGLNQDKGKASADILGFKKKIADLEKAANAADDKGSEYKEVAEALAKAGIDAKNADELLEKLNIKKSVEDENTILKDKLKELGEKVTGFETKEQVAARQEKVKPLFDTALAEFIKAKQEKDINYKLTDAFVDKENLFKEVDIDNDTLRNDHFSKVLQEADTKQQTFMKEYGMGYTGNVHKQGDTHGHYGNESGINKVASEAISDVRKAGGSMESAVSGMAQLHAAQKEKN